MAHVRKEPALCTVRRFSLESSLVEFGSALDYLIFEVVAMFLKRSLRLVARLDLGLECTVRTLHCPSSLARASGQVCSKRHREGE